MHQISSILLISLILFSSSLAFAQQPITGENINVKIDENGTAHIVQTVSGSNYSPLNIETIQGNMRYLSVTDAENNTLPYSFLQENETIVIPPSARNMTMIKYDLTSVLSFSDGVWKWDYRPPPGVDFTSFYFPQKVDTIWANDRPIYLGEHGLAQHGDGMKLEYATNETTVLHNIRWQNYNFTVTTRTFSDVKSSTFDQSSMTYSFQIDKPNSLVTVIIPQSLLGGNYKTLINNNHLLTNVFHNNGTHAWIGVRPSENGTITVIGTTVIPEFPFSISSVMGIAMILVLQLGIIFSRRMYKIKN